MEAAAGNVARARALLARGLSLFPYNTKIMNVSAAIEEQAGNIEGARALHRRALNVDSSSLTTMHNRVSWADLELRAGQVTTARALLQEGLDRHPAFPAALALMARLERGQGALDLAEAYARRAQKVGRGGGWVVGVCVGGGLQRGPPAAVAHCQGVCFQTCRQHLFGLP